MYSIQNIDFHCFQAYSTEEPAMTWKQLAEQASSAIYPETETLRSLMDGCIGTVTPVDLSQQPYPIVIEPTSPDETQVIYVNVDSFENYIIEFT